MKTIIIMLDVDGVLNNSKSFQNFDPENMACFVSLYHLLGLNNAVKVIISSSWRYSHTAMPVLRSELLYYGIRIQGQTPFLKDDRSSEIKAFLDKEPPEAWDECIVLDDLDADPMMENVFFYKTDCREGLTADHVRDILSKHN